MMKTLHDPLGPDLQSHWQGEELIITISDKLAATLGWHEGDTVVFTVDEQLPKAISITKKS